MTADANISIARPGASRQGLFAGGNTPLPPDVAAQAAGRLERAAWIFVATWILVLAMNEWLFAGSGAQGIVWAPRQTFLTLLGLAAAIAMVVLSRQLRSRPELMIDIALVFQVVTSLIVALITEYYPRQDPQAISWVCVTILTLPMIAPSTPRKTLIASLLSAATVPLALAWTRSMNPAYDPPLSVMIWFTAPPFICALLSVIPATVIRGLGRQVKRAREIGSYQLEEKIGGGGMGDVFRATHRLLARPAAVKLISPAVLNSVNTDATRIATERFRREAQAAASLTSPHTIDLYDYGVAEDGAFYYVMELLDGINFQELVTLHGPQPAERVAHLLRQTCDSLGEAHALGLVHRDVKPSNILACRMGLSVDYVKVLDFGLVKKDPSKAELETQITSAGSVSGTPAFMSPETISASGDVGPPADVYALGCVGYWLLTGQTVFKAANATMMMMQHLQASPIPPSLRAPQPVPPGLERIIMQCLAKDPDDRPSDAAELASMVGQCRLPLEWTEVRARDWWREHRTPLAAENLTGSIVIH